MCSLQMLRLASDGELLRALSRSFALFHLICDDFNYPQETL